MIPNCPLFVFWVNLPILLCLIDLWHAVERVEPILALIIVGILPKPVTARYVW